MQLLQVMARLSCKMLSLLVAAGSVLLLCGKVAAQTDSSCITCNSVPLPLQQVLIFATIIAVLSIGFLVAVAVAIRATCSRDCCNADEALPQSRKSTSARESHKSRHPSTTVASSERRWTKTRSGGTVEFNLEDAASRAVSGTVKEIREEIDDDEYEGGEYATAAITSNEYMKPDIQDQEYTTATAVFNVYKTPDVQGPEYENAVAMTSVHTTADEQEQEAPARATISNVYTTADELEQGNNRATVTSNVYTTADVLEQGNARVTATSHVYTEADTQETGHAIPNEYTAPDDLELDKTGEPGTHSALAHVTDKPADEEYDFVITLSKLN